MRLLQAGILWWHARRSAAARTRANGMRQSHANEAARALIGCGTGSVSIIPPAEQEPLSKGRWWWRWWVEKSCFHICPRAIRAVFVVSAPSTCLNLKITACGLKTPHKGIHKVNQKLYRHYIDIIQISFIYFLLFTSFFLLYKTEFMWRTWKSQINY